MSEERLSNLIQVQQDIASCCRCPRLLAWCQQVAQEKVLRYAEESYWGKPVPSFGDGDAQLCVVGLAPAAHGANRTGRMFTGDRSGEWLFRALYKAGFANQPTSTHVQDGLRLQNCYITGIAHCAPPANKLLPQEIENCRPYFLKELEDLQNLRVIVALGKLAFDQTQKAMQIVYGSKMPVKMSRITFSHGAEVILPNSILLVGSYHPSQQNTFTRKLTEPMLDAVFQRAQAWIESF